jgi:hypothetical protein
VLSFAEGLPTPLAGFIPKVVIVPFESAYPGFGTVRVLSQKDHVDICKPLGREDDSYRELLRFVRASVGLDDGDDDGGGGSDSGDGEGPAASAGPSAAATAAAEPAAAAAR